MAAALPAAATATARPNNVLPELAAAVETVLDAILDLQPRVAALEAAIAALPPSHPADCSPGRVGAQRARRHVPAVGAP